MVFASDPIESHYVLPHHELLYVLSREHIYTQTEFDLIARSLAKIIEDKWPPTHTPHTIWRNIALKRPKGSNQTYLERALMKYEAELEVIKKSRR